MGWQNDVLRTARKNPNVTVVGMERKSTPASRALLTAERKATEDYLCAEIIRAGFPEPEREYRFIAGRRFKADFAWPDLGIIVEYQGGGERGAHQRIKGYTKDRERQNLAALHGWLVIEITPLMLKDLEGYLFEPLRSAFRIRDNG